jgi:hypothetical protein
MLQGGNNYRCLPKRLHYPKLMFFLTTQKVSRRIVKGMDGGTQIRLDWSPQVQFEVNVASSWLKLFRGSRHALLSHW